MLDISPLPVHPTRRHPLTGEPLQALGHRKDGRTIWPILGGDDTVPPAGQQTAPPANSNTGGGGSNATDAQGRDLGYPADTPVAEMNDKQQAAYWKHQSRGHENRYVNLLGGRKADEVKADLDAYATIQREQMTPADQALAARFDEGKAEGRKAALSDAALAIFRGALTGVPEADLEEFEGNFNAGRYITDNGIDAAKITAFAKRLTGAPPATGTQPPRTRNFGAGTHEPSPSPRGSAGRAEAQRRFGKQSKSGD